MLPNTRVASASAHFDTTADADLYASVFTSQARHFGDQIGNLTPIGYVGSNGGHLVS